MDRVTLEALMDRLVAEYSDRLQAGRAPAHQDLLQQLPADQRPELERLLRMIDLGLAAAPGLGHPLVPGLVLGHYRIERELGRGGMAIVYLARDLDLQRDVALKVLRPGLALERRHVDRFEREALAIAKLDHPNLVRVWGVGHDLGYHWLAMELVDGPTLGEVLRQVAQGSRPGPQDLARVSGVAALAGLGPSWERCLTALLEPVARGLAAAHELGLVHRDVKPSNILIHRDGRPVLADFGLARDETVPTLSLTGDTLGTPSYMSPEQVASQRERIDRRTDIYSLGVTLYEGLTGKRPFEGPTALAVLEAIRTRRPVPLRAQASDCTRDAEAVVEKAMAREPDDRYADASALARDLEQLAAGRPSEARSERGSRARRFSGQLALATSGHDYEYRSVREFLGLPLVHVNTGQRRPGEPPRVARGWIAVSSEVAVGAVAVGGRAAFGGVAVGGAFALGLVSVAGALSCGLLGALAGAMAIGGFAMAGGLALGVLASAGGFAAGWAAFAGGSSAGYYALAGGQAFGPHTVDPHSNDPAAMEFFEAWMPWTRGMFE